MPHNEQSQKDHDRGLRNENDIEHLTEQVGGFGEMVRLLNNDVVRAQKDIEALQANTETPKESRQIREFNWTTVIAFAGLAAAILAIILKR